MAIELHPLDQFKIEPIIPIHIGGVDASFTNSALFMVLTVLLTFFTERKTPSGQETSGAWVSDSASQRLSNPSLLALHIPEFGRWNEFFAS